MKEFIAAVLIVEVILIWPQILILALVAACLAGLAWMMPDRLMAPLAKMFASFIDGIFERFDKSK